MYYLGSQVTVLLFILLCMIFLFIVTKVFKKKLSEEDTEMTIGCFIGAGLVFGFICFILYTCSHSEEY